MARPKEAVTEAKLSRIMASLYTDPLFPRADGGREGILRDAGGTGFPGREAVGIETTFCNERIRLTSGRPGNTMGSIRSGDPS